MACSVACLLWRRTQGRVDGGTGGTKAYTSVVQEQPPGHFFGEDYTVYTLIGEAIECTTANGMRRLPCQRNRSNIKSNVYGDKVLLSAESYMSTAR